MYFKGFPDSKFSQKELLSLLKTDRQLAIAFATCAKEALSTLLSDTSNQAAEEEVFDLNQLVFAL
jgi:hypothetical protein